jgi:hypothetical protein
VPIGRTVHSQEDPRYHRQPNHPVGRNQLDIPALEETRPRVHTVIAIRAHRRPQHRDTTPRRRQRGQRKHAIKDIECSSTSPGHSWWLTKPSRLPMAGDRSPIRPRVTHPQRHGPRAAAPSQASAGRRPRIKRNRGVSGRNHPVQMRTFAHTGSAVFRDPRLS